MNIELDLQIAVTPTLPLPSAQDFEGWVGLVLGREGKYLHPEMCIRIVDESESQSLNKQYRQQDKSTNVLSFPAMIPPGVEYSLLGDLVICQTIIEQEALTQHKPLFAHWAHMVIHGTLHLLGYNHEIPSEAEEMEHIEIELLALAGYLNPYEFEKTQPPHPNPLPEGEGKYAN